MRIWQGVGFTIGFAMAKLLSFRLYLWVLLSTVVLAAIVNVILELTTQSREGVLPCIYRRHRKSCDDVESSGATNMSSRRSLPESGQGIIKGQSDEVPSQEHKKLSQNPIFTVYQGHRPSAMSTWSADSLDGTLPSTSAISAAGQSLHQNRQNPIFVEYEGHQLSTDSASVNKNKTFPQSTSEGAHNVHAMCSTGRRPSATSLFADSLDGTLPSVSSHLNAQCHPPPTTTTVACGSKF